MTAVKNVEGIMEPLSAAVRLDLRPAGVGACVCPPGTLYAACTCSWSVMIDRLLQLGYTRSADPVTLVRELGDTSAMIADQLSQARRRGAVQVCRSWTGTGAALARYLGYRSVNSLWQMIPDAMNAMMARNGTSKNPNAKSRSFS